MESVATYAKFSGDKRMHIIMPETADYYLRLKYDDGRNLLKGKERKRIKLWASQYRRGLLSEMRRQSNKRGDEIKPDATIQLDGLPKMIGRTCNGLALWSYHDDCNPV